MAKLTFGQSVLLRGRRHLRDICIYIYIDRHLDVVQAEGLALLGAPRVAPIFLSISSFHPSIFLSIYIHICTYNIHLSIYLSIYIFVYLSIYPYTHTHTHTHTHLDVVQTESLALLGAPRIVRHRRLQPLVLPPAGKWSHIYISQVIVAGYWHRLSGYCHRFHCRSNMEHIRQSRPDSDPIRSVSHFPTI